MNSSASIFLRVAASTVLACAVVSCGTPSRSSGAKTEASAAQTEGPAARPELIAEYDKLADSILDARKTEVAIVHKILAGIEKDASAAYGHAKASISKGDSKGATAAVEDLATLVAQLGTEGDASVARVRKRLIEGGHHFNPILGAGGPGGAHHDTGAHPAQDPAHPAAGSEGAAGAQAGHAKDGSAHHAGGDQQGEGGSALGYDPGFVVVSRATKKALLDVSRTLSQLAAAPTAEPLQAEWTKVQAIWTEMHRGAQ